MSDLAQVTRVIVPQQLVDETQKFLRNVGQTGREGMVLWVGQLEDSEFRVTTLLIPKQKGLKTKDGVCVVVDSDEMHRINVELYKARLKLIGQVHSHPTEAYHSDTDDAYAIASVTGSLSIVVPDFAKGKFNFHDCAVYRLKENGEWAHLSSDSAARLIRIAD